MADTEIIYHPKNVNQLNIQKYENVIFTHTRIYTPMYTAIKLMLNEKMKWKIHIYKIQIRICSTIQIT